MQRWLKWDKLPKDFINTTSFTIRSWKIYPFKLLDYNVKGMINVLAWVGISMILGSLERKLANV